MKIYYARQKAMPAYSFRLPDGLIRKIDEYVMRGIFISRSEFIRTAIRRLIKIIDEMIQSNYDAKVIRMYVRAILSGE